MVIWGQDLSIRFKFHFLFSPGLRQSIRLTCKIKMKKAYFRSPKLHPRSERISNEKKLAVVRPKIVGSLECTWLNPD